MNFVPAFRDGIHKDVAARATDPVDAERVRAWTDFWNEQEPQSRCLASASPELNGFLSDHWLTFGSTVPWGTRVLDIGCGSGVVARVLASAQPHLHLVGIDSAQVPDLGPFANVRILPGIEIESLPFAEGAFGAAVSQFGFEYSRIDAATKELARVLRPGAPFSFIVHHSESPIVRADRRHNRGLRALTSQKMREMFLAGERAALRARLEHIVREHPGNETIAFAARCLALKVGGQWRARLAMWDAFVSALAPDRTLSDALEFCCVAPDRLRDWIDPLRASFTVDRPAALVVLGEPVGWKIASVRRG